MSRSEQAELPWTPQGFEAGTLGSPQVQRSGGREDVWLLGQPLRLQLFSTGSAVSTRKGGRELRQRLCCWVWGARRLGSQTRGHCFPSSQKMVGGLQQSVTWVFVHLRLPPSFSQGLKRRFGEPAPPLHPHAPRSHLSLLLWTDGMTSRT